MDKVPFIGQFVVLLACIWKHIISQTSLPKCTGHLMRKVSVFTQWWESCVMSILSHSDVMFLKFFVQFCNFVTLTIELAIVAWFCKELHNYTAILHNLRLFILFGRQQFHVLLQKRSRTHRYVFQAIMAGKHGTQGSIRSGKIKKYHIKYKSVCVMRNNAVYRKLLYHACTNLTWLCLIP